MSQQTRFPSTRKGADGETRTAYTLTVTDNTGTGGVGCNAAESVAYCRSQRDALEQAKMRERDRFRVERMEVADGAHDRNPLASIVHIELRDLRGNFAGVSALRVSDLLALPDYPEDEGAWWNAYTEIWHAADPDTLLPIAPRSARSWC